MNPIIEINTEFLKENLFNIRDKVGRAKIMAMVKANAYGHGVKEIIRVFENVNYAPDYYGVAFLDEALEIQNLIKKPILITEPLLEDEIKKYIIEANSNIRPTLSSEDNLNLWDKLLKKPIKIHIKINSGMNRLGLRKEEAVKFIKNVIANNKFIIDGVYTHFAKADKKDDIFTKNQLEIFKSVINNLKNYDLGLIHAANSGAILNYPESYFDMVRPGILLYGYNPSLGYVKQGIKIKPIMSLGSYVAEISYVNKGELVGYGGEYIANKKHKIASMPMGYADGIQRGLSNRIRVLIKKSFYKQIGVISMDRMSICLNKGDILIGEKVIIIGQEGNKKIDFWDWAEILNTIPYELMCTIGDRFSRKYL